MIEKAKAVVQEAFNDYVEARAELDGWIGGRICFTVICYLVKFVRWLRDPQRERDDGYMDCIFCDGHFPACADDCPLIEEVFGSNQR